MAAGVLHHFTSTRLVGLTLVERTPNMEVRWVDRDAEGKICGHYARKQREDQVSIPEDDPELVVFNEASKAQMKAAQKAAADKDALIIEMKASLDLVNAKMILMDAEIKALKDAKP